MIYIKYLETGIWHLQVSKLHKPCREIGQLKEAIKEAILEGEIPNDHQASYDYMLQKGKELGLKIL